MRKIMLDTNFILTCVKQKIDFFEELKNMDFDIIIPLQVINEIKAISNSKKKLRFRESAEIAMRLLNQNKFKTLDLGKGDVDGLIIKYAKANSNAVIATLDREIKSKTLNQKGVIRGLKKIEII